MASDPFMSHIKVLGSTASIWSCDWAGRATSMATDSRGCRLGANRSHGSPPHAFLSDTCLSPREQYKSDIEAEATTSVIFWTRK